MQNHRWGAVWYARSEDAKKMHDKVALVVSRVNLDQAFNQVTILPS